MLEIPAGYYQVESTILPRGMGSYVKTMMKNNLDRQEIGAHVNGRSITCIFENGELLCLEVNKCFMKKILSFSEPRGIDLEEEMKNMRPELDTDILMSVFTEEDPEMDNVVVPEDKCVALSVEHGPWMEHDQTLSFSEIGISIVNSAGQMDSTVGLELMEVNQGIASGKISVDKPTFWENVIPPKDKANLYDFLSNLKSGTDIHLVARGKPLLTVKVCNQQYVTSGGKDRIATEMVIVPPEYQGYFPPDNILAYGTPVRWMMFSVYYLLYWVFKLVEHNLGREFDRELGKNDNISHFKITRSKS